MGSNVCWPSFSKPMLLSSTSTYLRTSFFPSHSSVQRLNVTEGRAIPMHSSPSSTSIFTPFVLSPNVNLALLTVTLYRTTLQLNLSPNIFFPGQTTAPPSTLYLRKLLHRPPTPMSALSYQRGSSTCQYRSSRRCTECLQTK